MNNATCFILTRNFAPSCSSCVEVWLGGKDLSSLLLCDKEIKEKSVGIQNHASQKEEQEQKYSQ